MPLSTTPNVWIDGEWLIAAADGALTNAVLITALTGHEILITKVAAMLDKDGSANVAVRIGHPAVGASTLPTAALTGVDGILASHPDVEPGSGFIDDCRFRVPAGKNLLITCDAATGGNLTITARYMYVPTGTRWSRLPLID